MVSSPFARPSTPGRSPPAAESETMPSIPEGKDHPPRRSSLGFLRRSKSGDLSGRNSSGTRLTRKRSANQRQDLLRRQREAAGVPQSPPRLPDIYDTSFQSLGPGDLSSTVMRASADGRSPRSPSHPPIPPIPTNSPTEQPPIDPYARTESMTHRGRYSYASSAISTINSPRKVRRRKDPTPFNVLVVGARDAGKTSFLNFLRSSLALSKRKGFNKIEETEPALPRTSSAEGGNSAFESQYLETEIDGERVGLTLWDSQGLEKNVVDLQLREMTSFLESKFEETFTEEMKVVRAPGVQDTHIHCVFLLLDPARLTENVAASKASLSESKNGVNGKHGKSFISGLDENLDLQVLRALQGKTTVVPVISKADTITSAHMGFLKRLVWDGLKRANLDPLEALGLDELDADADADANSDIEEKDEEVESSDSSMLIKQSNTDQEESVDPLGPARKEAGSTATAEGAAADRPSPRSSLLAPSGIGSDSQVPYLPLSIISPDAYDPGTIGRKFPWGFADPYDPDHCDFVRLKDAVFNQWRGELREASRELWYEGWRTSRLRKRRPSRPGPPPSAAAVKRSAGPVPLHGVPMARGKV
ncbi:MAG: hypothetical protein M1838_000558 [Thelocarpon superellum]|nr:MAG: hypothetical protein M1838_000558 [Thelocarpon superellum]